MAAENEITSARTNDGSCKMVRHDFKAMLAEIVWSLQEPVTSDQTVSVTAGGDFQAQQQRLQQLNEYCEQTIDEIRASLERT